MKRKLIAIILIACMALVAVTGATLAYFTDKDQVKNEFHVGNVDIDLWEIVGEDEDGEDITVGKDTDTTNSYTYTNLFPTDEITKEVNVTNNDNNNSVYVRVTVVMNNLGAINNAIDNFYEAKGYTADQIQAIYDEVFNGWGINYSKRLTEVPDEINGGTKMVPYGSRMWMDDRTGTGSPVLCNIDTIAYIEAGNSDYYRIDCENQFMTAAEREAENGDGIFQYGWGDPMDDLYYQDAFSATDARAYIFYLELPAGATYTLFDGLKVPAEFNEKQAEMFEGLKIDVYADAIQTTGFDGDWEAAFEALNRQLPIGHWYTT